MNESQNRDQAVLDALDKNIKLAPQLGVCAESFAALKEEFLRVMQERDDALARYKELTDNDLQILRPRN